MFGPLNLFLASAAPVTLGSSDFSWWQAVGGTVAVFALLMVFLRLLGRWQRPPNRGNAALLDTWVLGPRREIQILRLHNEVHYIYRHEAALVLLQKEDLASFQAQYPPRAHRSTPWLGNFLSRLPFSTSPSGEGTPPVRVESDSSA
jgi:hypothetical protein